jgi:AcrR family transcriptional regulator
VPRPFTTDETDQIRARLLQAGREAFARRGVRATTVEDLAHAAGISKGAFYRFYPSKEALFMALLDDYETAVHREVEAAVRADPAHGVDLLVDASVHAIDRNPLIPVLMSDEGLRVIQAITPDQREALLSRDVRLVRRVLGVLGEHGLSPGVSERVLLGLLRSLVFVGRHQQEIGPDLVEEVSSWLKLMLRTGLSPATSEPDGQVR